MVASEKLTLASLEMNKLHMFIRFIHWLHHQCCKLVLHINFKLLFQKYWKCTDLYRFQQPIKEQSHTKTGIACTTQTTIPYKIISHFMCQMIKVLQNFEVRPIYCFKRLHSFIEIVRFNQSKKLLFQWLSCWFTGKCCTVIVV